MLAHNAASHVHKLMTSKNVCSPIQERSLLFTQPFGCSQCNNTHTTPQNLKMRNAHPFVQEKGISDVSSATILAIVLVISRITSPRTLEKNSLPVSNATTLAVTQIVSLLTHLFAYPVTITDYFWTKYADYWLKLHTSVVNWTIFPGFLFHLDEIFR